METRSKMRRLMLSYVSPRVSDLPATFESLNDDTLGLVLEFVGNKSYRSLGGLNKHCKEIYISSKMEKKTFVYGYAPLSVITNRIENAWVSDIAFFKAVSKGVLFYNRSDVMDWAVEEQNEHVLRDICEVAAEEGRVDLLDKLWNNVNDEDDKKYVFGSVDGHAARGGKLNVLKWIETKGLSICNRGCRREAIRGGHLHILKWLREEKDLELHGSLFNSSIEDDHLHVLKWLREQEVPWDERTFVYAARGGNLDILQWLHDESCPWPNNDTYRVGEYALKPYVVKWCRGNGYRDRMYRL